MLRIYRTFEYQISNTSRYLNNIELICDTSAGGSLHEPSVIIDIIDKNRFHHFGGVWEIADKTRKGIGKRNKKSLLTITHSIHRMNLDPFRKKELALKEPKLGISFNDFESK